MGTYTDLTNLAGFGFSCATPTGSYSTITHAGNLLVIEAHDADARTIRGGYTVHASIGQVANGMFDLHY